MSGKLKSSPCPTCGKPLHWRRKRLLSGTPVGPVGRPRITDYSEIKRLRRTGLSIRQIAFIAKCSTGAVQAALKEIK